MGIEIEESEESGLVGLMVKELAITTVCAGKNYYTMTQRHLLTLSMLQRIQVNAATDTKKGRKKKKKQCVLLVGLSIGGVIVAHSVVLGSLPLSISLTRSLSERDFHYSTLLTPTQPNTIKRSFGVLK